MGDERDPIVRLIEGDKITEIPLPMPLLWWPYTINYRGKIFAHMVNGRYCQVECLVLADTVEVRITRHQQYLLPSARDSLTPF